MTDFFKSLKLDVWYMVLVYLGGVLLVFSLFIPTQGITNRQLTLLSLGMLFIGLGEWKNHKYLSVIKPPNAYTGPAALFQTRIRQRDLVGILMDFAGLVFLVAGILDFFHIF